MSIEADGLMQPFEKHLLICVGPYCDENGMTPAAVKAVGRTLVEKGLLGSGESKVKPTLVKCLGACSAGPIMCVYPEGAWYAGVTLKHFEKVASDHLQNGRVVEELLFHRSPATRS